MTFNGKRYYREDVVVQTREIMGLGPMEGPHAPQP